ncbi:MAG: uncharacterized SAM-binding protein YcdF (DUF218 family) [Kiritimatiellia bacterium]|jgi:uncharacterized SAM-binding protein YcdF (DUF218 family)
MDLFIIKKLVSRLLFPLPISMLLLVAGLLLLWFSQRKKTGHLLLVAGIVLLFLFSFSPTSTRLLRPLEYAVPAYLPAFVPGVDAPKDTAEPIWICVPGSSWTPHAGIPLTSRMDPFFAERMLEAARVSRMFTHTRLIVGMASPGSHDQKEAFLEGYANLTGMNTNFVILTEVSDTESEIKQMKALVGKGRAVVVSTASHIPRVMALCNRYGLKAEAAPCGHRTLPGTTIRKMRLDDYYPNAASLMRSERALYEYLGLGWERVKAFFASQSSRPVRTEAIP